MCGFFKENETKLSFNYVDNFFYLFYSVFHWFEVNVRLRLMGMGKAQHVEKLNDEMAIDLGAEMLGEFVIYSVAAMTIYFEYNRSSSKEQIKEEQHRHEMISLQQKIQELGLTTERQEAQLRELERIVNDLDSRNKSLTSRIFGSGKSIAK